MWYGRVSTGYFEPAYGGLAAEFLYYPVGSNWAIGIEAAGVLKRNYHGIGFTTKIRKFDGFSPEFVHFIDWLNMGQVLKRTNSAEERESWSPLFVERLETC